MREPGFYWVRIREYPQAGMPDWGWPEVARQRLDGNWDVPGYDLPIVDDDVKVIGERLSPPEAKASKETLATAPATAPADSELGIELSKIRDRLNALETQINTASSRIRVLEAFRGRVTDCLDVF